MSKRRNAKRVVPGILRVRTIILFALNMGAMAAGARDTVNQWANSNVVPGDADYPKLASKPEKTVILAGRLPRKLQLQLLVSYASDSGKSDSKDCRYKYNNESFPNFSIIEPLTIIQEGDRFHTTIVVDKYLTGRCHWHFNGVAYKWKNNTDELTENWFALAYQPERDGSKIDALPRGPVTVWCKAIATQPHTLERCTNPSTLQLIAKIPRNIIARFSKEELSNRGVTWLLPDTRAIQVNFFDLDAMPAAGGLPY